MGIAATLKTSVGVSGKHVCSETIADMPAGSMLWLGLTGLPSIMLGATQPMAEIVGNPSLRTAPRSVTITGCLPPEHRATP